jgi:hypothetical protein
MEKETSLSWTPELATEPLNFCSHKHLLYLKSILILYLHLCFGPTSGLSSSSYEKVRLKIWNLGWFMED